MLSSIDIPRTIAKKFPVQLERIFKSVEFCSIILGITSLLIFS